MPVTLRKRPQCHYCGKRLNTAKREEGRIPCDQCSADNYLDSNNNILDVPDTAVNRRSAQSQLVEIESESDVFCKTCLTNQAFYVQALSNYLPDESDSQYQRLLDGLPEYEKSLELRYPQCCTQCEPRAAARIQQANYMAKSDHLRRILHKQHDRTRSARLRFRRLLISAAGLGYAASLLLQLCWHALASQANSQHIIPGITPVQCFRYWPVPSQCTHYVASFVPISLLLGLLCIWWNPKWQYRLSGRDGRLIGLTKFYQMQFLILILRFAAWAIIQDLPAIQDRTNAVHTVAFVILSTVSVYVLTSTVKVDTTPLVDWQKVQAPLVRPDQFRPPAQSDLSPPASQSTSTLDIANFAAPPSAMYEPWKPPTPPTEDDGMDWAPSTHDFNPQPRMPKPKFEQKNPFYGTLPAAPVRGSLNPKAPPPPAQKKALGVPPGFFGLSKSKIDDHQVPASQADPRDAFAPPKFFPNKQETDTGLENIFDKMFSVRDSQSVATPGRKHPQQSNDIFGQQKPSLQQQQLSESSVRHYEKSNQSLARMVLSSTIMIALAITVSVLCTHELRQDAATRRPFQVVPYLASIPVVHVFEEAFYTDRIEITGLVISAFKISMAAIAYTMLPDSNSDLIPIWNKGVIGIIIVFMVEEIYRLCQLQSTELIRQPALYTETVPDNAREQLSRRPPQYIEETTVSHPSPQQPVQYAPPTQILGNAFSNRDFGTVRKRDSDESISSVSSVNTTSTASGWKTPQNTGRTFDWQSSDRTRSGRRSSSGIGLPIGGLSLGNDFGSGANIAGPRTRQTPGGGNGRSRQPGW